MKRKLITMSLAMIAGLPHAAFANSSNKQDVKKQSLIALEELERPLYAGKRAVPPMREHLIVKHSNQHTSAPNNWRLDFGMPRAEAVGAPDVYPAKEVFTGISLGMKF